MPCQIVIGPAVTATFETFSAITPRNGRTLLLNTHGMQDPGYYAPINGGVIPVAPRNYAFTVPFDTALYNPSFKNNENNTYRYTKKFIENSNQFSSRAPGLSIYPFYADISWRPVFEMFVMRDLCDIAHFSDLAGADYISLDDLLRAQHWGGGGTTIADTYSSFLLLTCRSNA